MYETILVDKENKIGFITLNKPEIRNAVGVEMRIELVRALDQLDQDQDVRCIILTGAGKFFSAGGELKGLQEVTILEGRKRVKKGQQVILKILEIETPVIAAVNGGAAGAGCALAIACDLVVAEEDAFFVQSFTNIGLIPDLGSLHFLPLLVGVQRAKELMFLGNKITANDALQYGMINKVVPKREVIDAAKKLAGVIVEKSPVSIGLTKRYMNQHIHNDVRQLLELEATAQDLCLQSDDFSEGVNAFFEKRKPEFKGR